jgi:hypothetical protein
LLRAEGVQVVGSIIRDFRTRRHLFKAPPKHKGRQIR